MKIQLHNSKSVDPGSDIIYLIKNKKTDKKAGLSKEQTAYVQKALEGDSAHAELNLYTHFVYLADQKDEKDASLSLEAARSEGNKAFNFFKSKKVQTLQIADAGADAAWVNAFLEGFLLSAYSFDRYLGKKDKDAKEKALKLQYHGNADIQSLKKLAEAVHFTRDLVNEPYNHLGVKELVKEAKAMCAEYHIKFEVFNKKKIESLKMGGILGVNQASIHEPAFLIMEYKPAKAKNKKPMVLVGKGVVYDTGGASLKPSGGMETMKCDMAGAAAVIGTLRAVAAAGLPVHLIGITPLTDNCISASSMVPGDVITMYSGKTVEVLNTDAEGRLILADALHYAKKFNPELVIDLATLTGAAVRAIGDIAIAAMEVNAGKYKTQLEDAGSRTFERLVWFPMWKEYGDMIKSDIADIKNLGGPEAGQITAAKFLEHFTDYPWIHLDIAGPAFLGRNSGYRGKGATGNGVRLLFDFIKSL